MISHQIKSRFIKSVSFAKERLTVEFKGGSRFRYVDVPMKVFTGMCESELPGKYYTDNIKGKFKASKLEKHQE